MTPQEALAAALPGAVNFHFLPPRVVQHPIWDEVATTLSAALAGAGLSIVSTEELEGLRAVVKEARLVAQWHRSIGSGPIAVLDAELGDLGEHARAALEGAKP